MNKTRRGVLALGTTAAAALLVNTAGFSQSQVETDIDVAVGRDATAYLALTADSDEEGEHDTVFPEPYETDEIELHVENALPDGTEVAVTLEETTAVNGPKFEISPSGEEEIAVGESVTYTISTTESRKVAGTIEIEAQTDDETIVDLKRELTLDPETDDDDDDQEEDDSDDS